MGSFLSDLGKVIIAGVVGGPAGAVTVFTLEHGEEVVEGVVDLENLVVRIGDDVYRAIPPELLVVAGRPDLALLKHVAEDELLIVGHFVGEIALFGALSWPSQVGGALVWGRSLLEQGILKARRPTDEEWEMAQYIFADTLPRRNDIILTNLGGLNGDPFTYPMAPAGLPVMLNLASFYDDGRIPQAQVLFHELTHAWQAQRRVLREVFFYDARATLGGEAAYRFKPGSQWREYNIEQQASIVEGWTIGATRKPGSNFVNGRNKLALGSPLFRYVNANIRRADVDAVTSTSQSVRVLLAEGGHRSLKVMHPPQPAPWW
jgi:hypothetical protein